MDSLVANYASSDDEDQPDPQQPKNPSFSLFSLPPPKSSPPLHKPPKQEIKPIKPTSFSSLPPPKTRHADPKTLSTHFSSSIPKPKTIIQFRPPIIPIKSNNVDHKEEDDDYNEKLRKNKKESESSSAQTSSTKPLFSSLLPKPKNSIKLGALPSGSGTNRRAILEADTPVSNSSNLDNNSEVVVNLNVGNNESQLVEPSSSEHFVNYDGYGSNVNSNWGVESGNCANGYVGYGSCGEYGNYGNYESNWVDGSSATVGLEVSGMGEGGVMRMPGIGKRGRNDVPNLPIEVIEVKQDELMKNRPREDQVKLTGIAFGPSYQPVSSAKGKPSKLHKRKHQIGSLFFDMKQKETELSERRSKGFLTKAETQAKYGW